MTSTTPRRALAPAHFLLPVVLVAQAILHLTRLHPSTHSGQVAIPWLLNQGLGFFDRVVEQHAPGGSLLVAFFQRVLPLSPLETVQVLDLAFVLGTGVVIYALTLRLEGRKAAAFALVFWALWEPVYHNIMFYYDALVGLMLVASVLVWLALSDRRPRWLRPLLAGLLLGGATLFKQHAWLGVALFGLWLLWQDRARLLAYIPGALLLPLVLVGVLAAQGRLESYLYWNWTFNLTGAMPSEGYSGDFLRKLLLTANFGAGYGLLVLRADAPRQARRVLVLLMALGGAATLIPRGGEYHVMGLLPTLAVMTGTVVGQVVPSTWQPRTWLRTASPATLTLAGVSGVILGGWALTGIAPYFGPTATPAHDEFLPLVEELRELSTPEDTLFILPETDSTPQIHALAEMLPPGLWVKGWAWYFDAPGVTDRLLAEWAENPPDYVVVFPNLLVVGEPGITPLADLLETEYEPVGGVADVLYHGPATIYRHH